MQIYYQWQWYTDFGHTIWAHYRVCKKMKDRFYYGHHLFFKCKYNIKSSSCHPKTGQDMAKIQKKFYNSQMHAVIFVEILMHSLKVRKNIYEKLPPPKIALLGTPYSVSQAIYFLEYFLQSRELFSRIGGFTG